MNFPGTNNWQIAPFDLGARIFPFGSSKSGEVYLQGGFGYNLLSLSSSAKTSGDYHMYLGAGYRAFIFGPDMALDLGAQCDYYSRLANLPPLYDAGIKAGLTFFFGTKNSAGEPVKKTAQAPAEKTPAASMEPEGAEAVEVNLENSSAKPETANGPSVAAAEVPQASPTSLLGAYKRGIQAYHEKSYSKSIECLLKSTRMKDSSVPSYYRAEAYAMVGLMYEFNLLQAAKAAKYYRLALKIDPLTGTARKYIGSVRMMADFDAGIEAYRKKHFKKAASLFKKALREKSPKVPNSFTAEIYTMLGLTCQFYLHQPKAAQINYREALRIFPNTKTARKYLKPSE